MNPEYDTITAGHYRTYRPALHLEILKKCISVDEVFTSGLDIGCGTGQSTHALLKFCERVFGIEPSNEMLENVLEYPQIEYSYFDTKNLHFKENTFDVVTFAGSLFYGKSLNLLEEVIRVSQDNGAIIVYDFEVLLKELLQKLGFASSIESVYDHEVDFSGLQTDQLSEVIKGKETTTLNIDANHLAHLILSVKEHYVFFQNKWGMENVLQNLAGMLKQISGTGQFLLEVNIFYTRYKVIKK